MPHEILQWIAEYGYMGIFVALFAGIVGAPIPDETILTFAGYLVWHGDLRAVPAFGAGFLGSACGITASYLLGSVSGGYMVRRLGPFLHLTPDHLRRVHGWFNRFGAWTLTFGYFVPGVRHLTAYVAGASALEYRKFAAFAYPGAFLWAGTFLGAGYVLGAQWEALGGYVHRTSVVVGAAVFAVALSYLLLRHFRRTS